MEDILNSEFPRSYQVLNAGVGSYSSFQGLQRLKYALLKYRPDIVTIYFGWNDHWIASIPDSQVRMKAAWEVGLINFLERFRIYQAYHLAITRIKGKFKRAKKAGEPPIFRVSQGEYGKNLNAMIDLCLMNGIRPVLITAPYDPSQLKPSRIFPFPVETLIRTHRDYNNIVRQVGAARQVPVIDLEAAFIQLENQRPLAYFSDGTHFTPVGCRLVAGLIVQRLQELELVSNSAKRAAS
jgi:lysophospholipase L1-like esterase